MEQKKENIFLSVSGMHCASCAGIITRAIKKVSGVEDANVNFASEKAHVSYDSQIANVPTIVSAVEKAGYKARIYNAEDSEAVQKKK